MAEHLNAPFFFFFFNWGEQKSNHAYSRTRNQLNPRESFTRLFVDILVWLLIQTALLPPSMGWQGQGFGADRGQAAVVAPRSQQLSPRRGGNLSAPNILGRRGVGHKRAQREWQWLRCTAKETFLHVFSQYLMPFSAYCITCTWTLRGSYMSHGVFLDLGFVQTL